MEIETPVLLACVIEDSTDIFRISGGGGGLNNPNPPLGTPLVQTKLLHNPAFLTNVRTTENGKLEERRSRIEKKEC